MVLQITYLVILIVATRIIQLGGGHHVVYIDPTQVPTILLLNQVVPPFSIFSQVFAKTSITILWTRLMSPDDSGRKLFLWINLAVLWSISIVSTITTYVQCSPPSLLWTGTPAELAQNCWDPKTYTDIAVAQGAYSAFTDFLLALFPIVIVWKLQMSLTRKLSMCLLMGFGVLYVHASHIILSCCPLGTASSDPRLCPR